MSLFSIMFDSSEGGLCYDEHRAMIEGPSCFTDDALYTWCVIYSLLR